jgi:hypothetical protein
MRKWSSGQYRDMVWFQVKLGKVAPQDATYEPFVCADSDISILVAFPTRYIYVTPYNRALAYILIACYFRDTFNSWSCDLQRACTFFAGQKVGPGRCDLGIDTRPPKIRFRSILYR